MQTRRFSKLKHCTNFFISAERIDVWIGNDSNTSSEKDDNAIPFEYIGYITLSNNENTKFKCRELKTITIPSVEPTKYIKLTLYQNHPNNLNAYNQVFDENCSRI